MKSSLSFSFGGSTKENQNEEEEERPHTESVLSFSETQVSHHEPKTTTRVSLPSSSRRGTSGTTAPREGKRRAVSATEETTSTAHGRRRRKRYVSFTATEIAYPSAGTGEQERVPDVYDVPPLPFRSSTSAAPPAAASSSSSSTTVPYAVYLHPKGFYPLALPPALLHDHADIGWMGSPGSDEGAQDTTTVPSNLHTATKADQSLYPEDRAERVPASPTVTTLVLRHALVDQEMNFFFRFILWYVVAIVLLVLLLCCSLRSTAWASRRPCTMTTVNRAQRSGVRRTSDSSFFLSSSSSSSSFASFFFSSAPASSAVPMSSSSSPPVLFFFTESDDATTEDGNAEEVEEEERGVLFLCPQRMSLFCFGEGFTTSFSFSSTSATESGKEKTFHHYLIALLVLGVGHFFLLLGMVGVVLWMFFCSVRPGREKGALELFFLLVGSGGVVGVTVIVIFCFSTHQFAWKHWSLSESSRSTSWAASEVPPATSPAMGDAESDVAAVEWMEGKRVRDVAEGYCSRYEWGLWVHVAAVGWEVLLTWLVWCHMYVVYLLQEKAAEVSLAYARKQWVAEKIVKPLQVGIALPSKKKKRKKKSSRKEEVKVGKESDAKERRPASPNAPSSDSSSNDSFSSDDREGFIPLLPTRWKEGNEGRVDASEKSPTTITHNARHIHPRPPSCASRSSSATARASSFARHRPSSSSASLLSSSSSSFSSVLRQASGSPSNPLLGEGATPSPSPSPLAATSVLPQHRKKRKHASSASAGVVAGSAENTRHATKKIRPPKDPDDEEVDEEDEDEPVCWVPFTRFLHAAGAGEVPWRLDVVWRSNDVPFEHTEQEEHEKRGRRAAHTTERFGGAIAPPPRSSFPSYAEANGNASVWVFLSPCVKEERTTTGGTNANAESEESLWDAPFLPFPTTVSPPPLSSCFLSTGGGGGVPPFQERQGNVPDGSGVAMVASPFASAVPPPTTAAWSSPSSRSFSAATTTRTTTTPMWPHRGTLLPTAIGDTTANALASSDHVIAFAYPMPSVLPTTTTTTTPSASAFHRPTDAEEAERKPSRRGTLKMEGAEPLGTRSGWERKEETRERGVSPAQAGANPSRRRGGEPRAEEVPPSPFVLSPLKESSFLDPTSPLPLPYFSLTPSGAPFTVTSPLVGSSSSASASASSPSFLPMWRKKTTAHLMVHTRGGHQTKEEEEEEETRRTRTSPTFLHLQEKENNEARMDNASGGGGGHVKGTWTATDTATWRSKKEGMGPGSEGAAASPSMVAPPPPGQDRPPQLSSSFFALPLSRQRPPFPCPRGWEETSLDSGQRLQELVVSGGGGGGVCGFASSPVVYQSNGSGRGEEMRVQGRSRWPRSFSSEGVGPTSSRFPSPSASPARPPSLPDGVADDWVYLSDVDLWFSSKSALYWDPVSKLYYSNEWGTWQLTPDAPYVLI